MLIARALTLQGKREEGARFLERARALPELRESQKKMLNALAEELRTIRLGWDAADGAVVSTRTRPMRLTRAPRGAHEMRHRPCVLQAESREMRAAVAKTDHCTPSGSATSRVIPVISMYSYAPDTECISTQQR